MSRVYIKMERAPSVISMYLARFSFAGVLTPELLPVLTSGATDELLFSMDRDTKNTRDSSWLKAMAASWPRLSKGRLSNAWSRLLIS